MDILANLGWAMGVVGIPLLIILSVLGVTLFLAAFITKTVDFLIHVDIEEFAFGVIAPILSVILILAIFRYINLHGCAIQ